MGGRGSGPGFGGAPGLVLGGTNSVRSGRRVSPSSKAPSKTLEMNETRCSRGVTVRGEALTIKEEQEAGEAARCSAWA